MFAEPFLLDGGEFFVSFSVGIALNDHPADEYGLVRDADAAMFSAREGGRAKRARFDERLRERAVGRVTLESELEIARDALEPISATGVRVLVDDFASGYSSIARLDELTMVGVKIDRSFMATLGVEAKAESVVGAIADLAHALGSRSGARWEVPADALDAVLSMPPCTNGQAHGN